MRVRKMGKETLNQYNEPELWEDTEDELTTDTESDIGEESGKSDYSAFILTLDEESTPSIEKTEEDPVEEKVSHLSDEYAAEIKHIFQSYPDV